MYTGNSINQNDKKKYFTNISEGRYYIGTKDLSFNHEFDYDNGITIPYTYQKFKVAPKNSILMCIEGGSAGRKIGILKSNVCFGNKLCCFNPLLINEYHLYMFLQSTQFLTQFKDKMTGIIGGVSIKSLELILIPIPPIEEQTRIIKLYKAILESIS